jgi:hypothetical protein
VGGTVGVIDVGVACGTGGVEGAAWDATKVMGAAQGVAEVSEAGDEGVAQVLAVEPPTSMLGAVRSPRLGSDRQPLFRGSRKDSRTHYKEKAGSLYV